MVLNRNTQRHSGALWADASSVGPAKYMEPNASLIPGSTAAEQTVHALFRQIYARGSYTVWVKKRGVNGI